MKKLFVILCFLLGSVVLFSCSGGLDESNSFSVNDEVDNLTYTFYDFALEELYLDSDDPDLGYHCLTFKVMISNNNNVKYTIPTSLSNEFFAVVKCDAWYDNAFIDSLDYPSIDISEAEIEANSSVTGDVTIPLTENASVSEGVYYISFRNNEFYLDIASDASVTYLSEHEGVYTTENQACSFTISVGVSNGVEQIETETILCVSYGTNPDEDNFTADGICNIYDFVANMENFQTIDQTDDMTLLKPFVTVGSINVYDAEGNLLETWLSWDERVALATGQYIIRLSVSKTEANCYMSGHSYFVLNVS